MQLGLPGEDHRRASRATVAGVLFCIANPEQWLSQARIRATRYRGTDQATRQLDYQDMVGPICRSGLPWRLSCATCGSAPANNRAAWRYQGMRVRQSTRNEVLVLNPERDAQDRTFLYAANLSINEGRAQPVYCSLGDLAAGGCARYGGVTYASCSKRPPSVCWSMQHRTESL